jgi:hypothetical protein
MIDWAKRADAALDIAMRSGGVDSAHHKAWVIDQMIRALLGYDEDTKHYDAFIKEHNNGEDGPDTYEWDVGIAP